LIVGDRTKLLVPVARDNQQSGIDIEPQADSTTINGGETTGNSQQTASTYQNVDIFGTNTRMAAHVADAGSATNKPNFGYVVRTSATGTRLEACDVRGTYGGGNYLDQTGTAVVFPIPGAARAAAITAPTAPSAGYVQAEAAAMKTAVDAILTALTAYGITL
jgi:hypothetical protein